MPPDLVWATSNKTIATVADNGDGTATVTVKKGASGDCFLTATCDDLGQASARLWISVRDYAPRLDAAGLTMNLYQSSHVTAALLESYGNSIETVSLMEGSAPSGHFTASWADGELTITALDGTTKGSYKLTLWATCGNGETYQYPITMKVTETAPSITVKQSGKLNTFYTDSSTTLTVTAKGPQVEDVVVTNGDFTGEFENGVLTLTSAQANPGKAVTLEITLEGYEKAIFKTVTLSTVNTAPKLKLSATSSIINTALSGEHSTTFRILDSTGETLDLSDMQFKCASSFAEVSNAADTVTLALTNAASGNVTFTVQGSNWAKAVKLTHKITVQTKLPTVKLSSAAVKLNSLFPEMAESVTPILSQSNLRLRDVTVTSTSKGAEKLEVSFQNGNLVVRILDNTIKNGSYAFKCEGILESGDALKAVNLKVTVSATAPKVKLASTSFKLNQYLAGSEQVSTKVTVPAGYTLAGFDGLEGTPLSYTDGLLTACLDSSSLKGGSYSLYPLLIPNGGTTPVRMSTALKVKVTTYNTTALSATVSAKGKLDTLNPDSAITYTVKLKNCAGAIEGITLSGLDGNLFNAVLNDDGKVVLTLKEGVAYATNRSYKVQLDMTVCGKTVSQAVTVKVSQTALKVTATPASVICYQSAGKVTTTLKVTSPATAQIGKVALGAKTTPAFREALGDDDNLHVNAATGRVDLTLENPGLLTPGKSYTLYLAVTPKNAATNVAPVQIKVTVKVKG